MFKNLDLRICFEECCRFDGIHESVCLDTHVDIYIWIDVSFPKRFYPCHFREETVLGIPYVMIHLPENFRLQHPYQHAPASCH